MVQFSDRTEELVNAKACFLIVDLSNNNSFEFIKTVGYPKALKEIPKDGFMYLIGNKCDLDDKRKVNQEDFMQFASEKCMMYAEVWCL